MLLCGCNPQTDGNTTAELSAELITDTTAAEVTAEQTSAPQYIPAEEAVFTGMYFTGSPKVRLLAEFDESGAVCSPKSVYVGFVADKTLSGEINGWLAAALAELLAVRGDYIAECGGEDGFDDAHGSIFSRVTYESCEIEAINGYISITLGYIDNRAGAGITAWYACKTAVYDLIGGVRINSLAELFDGDYQTAVNRYVNSTYKPQLESTLTDFAQLCISGEYALPESPDRFTLTSVITDSGEWSRYGVQLPLGYEYIKHSRVWRERDFSGLTDFAATCRAVDSFGFAAFCEDGTRYVVPVSSLTLAKDDMSWLTEQRTTLARELAELYRSACGEAPACAEYSCCSGGLLSLRVGSEGDYRYFTVKEDGQPLTLADCLSGDDYTVFIHNAEHEYVTGEKPADLSEYCVFACYEQPEKVYFNCRLLNEATGDTPEVIDITALRGSVSEYCLEVYLGKSGE